MKCWRRLAAVMLAGGIVAAAAGCGSDKDNKDSIDAKKEKQEEITLEYTNKQPLPLWEKEEDMPGYDASVSGQAVTITPYIADTEDKTGCVIICPGGGYRQVVSEKEGSIPAEALNENGISAFVLHYRVAPYQYEAILSDVCRAVRFVRYYAEVFGIDPDKIAVMGFSAGGHLAAMELEHAEEAADSGDAIDKVSARADCGILCYPVISLEEPYAHKGSRENFLGDQADDETFRQKYSAELNVTSDTPPCFVWHCLTDNSVPYQNSQMFADAMQAAGVECEFHLYQWGGHGLGMAEGSPDACEWFPACVAWLRGRGY